MFREDEKEQNSFASTSHTSFDEQNRQRARERQGRECSTIVFRRKELVRMMMKQQQRHQQPAATRTGRVRIIFCIVLFLTCQELSSFHSGGCCCYRVVVDAAVMVNSSSKKKKKQKDKHNNGDKQEQQQQQQQQQNNAQRMMPSSSTTGSSRQTNQNNKRHHRHHHRYQFRNMNYDNEERKILFSQLFRTDTISNKKPRGLLEGVWNGCKSTMLGSFIGMISIIAFPLGMALQQQNTGNSKNIFLGIAMGTIFGSLLGVVATLTGIILGIYQVLLGLLVMPASIYAYWQGQHYWNITTEKWEFYNLTREEQDLLFLQSSSFNGSIADLTYYKLLDVPTNASTKDIKRAYYNKAKYVHPDKNPNDEDAAQKFLELHQAYQTLSDQERRAAYNSFGAAAAADAAGGNDFGNNNNNATAMMAAILNFNVDVFMEILFGSQLVEPYIGQLTVSTFMKQIVQLVQWTEQAQRQSSSSLNESATQQEQLHVLFSIFARDESDRRQRHRQVEIANNLLKRIEPLLMTWRQQEMDMNNFIKFRASCRDEANRIGQSTAAAAFGERILTVIGSELKLQADTYLALNGHDYHHDSDSSSPTQRRQVLLHHPLLALVTAPFASVYYLVHAKYRRIQQWLQSTHKTAQVILLALRHNINNSSTTTTDDSIGNGSDKTNKAKRRKNDNSSNHDYYYIDDDEQRQRILDFHQTAEELLPAIFDMIFSYNVRDVSKTLHGACWRLFADTSVTKKERIQRAKAIQILGQEFLLRGSDSRTDGSSSSDDDDVTKGKKANDIKARLKVAFHVAQQAQKGTGSKMSSEESEEMIKLAKRHSF